MVAVLKKTFTPSQVYGLNGTPAIILPAPPAGYVNNILGLTFNLVFVSAAYTTATILQVKTRLTTSDVQFQDASILPATVSKTTPAVKIADYLIVSTEEALYLTTNAVAATGDSPIDVYIVYEQKIISA